MAHAREEAVLGLAGAGELDVFFLERALDLLALRDVADRAGDKDAFLGFERAQADLDREFLAILAPAVELEAHAHRPHARVGEETVAMSWVQASIALGQQQLDGLLEKLGARIAEESLGLRVDEHDAARAVHDDDRVGCRLEEPAELLLGLLALGDVADRAHHERAFLGFEGAQADLDRKLGGVGTPPIELQSHAHGARAWGLEVVGAMTEMERAIAVREEGLDRLALQRAALVAEETLGLRVAEDDAAREIHDHDAVGHRFEHRQRGQVWLHAPPGFSPLTVAGTCELSIVRPS